MRIGIANPYAYRPHVGHMVFLVSQLEKLGHHIFFLGCNGSLDNCNSKLKKTGIVRKLECLKCQVGGIQSYLKVCPERLDLPIQLDADVIKLGRAFSYSSVATALQVEHVSQTEELDFQLLQDKLQEATATAFLNAKRWIRNNKLECVFVFNGRFDLTRAVVEACIAESVRFVSVERSWFGAGLQLLPNENCLGLRNFHDMCRHWASLPLTYEQAANASEVITRRLSRASVGEWKQYNIKSDAPYDRKAIKYLFLPSSQHEWMGQHDRSFEWRHPVDGIEYLFERLGLPMSDLVVRAHPGWAMNIKHYGCNRAADFYRAWTAKVGAQYLEPDCNIDTHGLIKISDIVLVNGSSASMEAAWLGKPLFSFVPAAFTSSGISKNLFTRADVDGLAGADIRALRGAARTQVDAREQCRLALRYIYCANFRLMQFIDALTSKDPFTFNVTEPGDLSGLESLVVEGKLQESDREYSADDAEESEVIDAILSGNTQTIRSSLSILARSAGAPIARRMAYRFIDKLSRS
jgi:hypothetical protein